MRATPSGIAVTVIPRATVIPRRRRHSRASGNPARAYFRAGCQRSPLVRGGCLAIGYGPRPLDPRFRGDDEEMRGVTTRYEGLRSEYAGTMRESQRR